MHKVTSLVTILTLASVLLAACAPAANATEPPATAAATTEAPAATEPPATEASTVEATPTSG